jgi:deoxyribodipyrimidine photo-lyase
MQTSPIIFWFRQDLRLLDHTALLAAVATGQPVIPLYIRDDDAAGAWKPGAASNVWLHHSLKALNKDLSGHMVFRKGDALTILKKLINDTGATEVFASRRYEPWAMAQDHAIELALAKDGIELSQYNTGLLWQPEHAVKDDGSPYQVYTAFYTNGCLKLGPPSIPAQKPRDLKFAPYGDTGSVDELDLLPPKREGGWDAGMLQHWQPGEAGALKRLDDFCDDHLKGYKVGRDFPAQRHTSRLSPHLHFGEISPNTVWYKCEEVAPDVKAGADLAVYHKELAWREFNYNLLFYNHAMPDKPLAAKFEKMPWDTAYGKNLTAWQRGQTGYPIVDAGMRELWQTGTMHNRVRMIVASFLVKHLMIKWQEGEAWFWDCLFDADLANNAGNWQWVAGCGADAAPYFRVFNPILQGEKFDPEGDYVRHFVPEIAKLPNKLIHKPWTADAAALQKAGIVLDKTYPAPIVAHEEGRARALAAFQAIK